MFIFLKGLYWITDLPKENCQKFFLVFVYFLSGTQGMQHAMLSGSLRSFTRFPVIWPQPSGWGSPFVTLELLNVAVS